MGMIFSFEDSLAKSVRINGDFKEELELKKVAENLWELELDLSPDIYNYNYVLDDQLELVDYLANDYVLLKNNK